MTLLTPIPPPLDIIIELGKPHRRCTKCKTMRPADQPNCPSCGLTRSRLIPDESAPTYDRCLRCQQQYVLGPPACPRCGFHYGKHNMAAINNFPEYVKDTRQKLDGIWEDRGRTPYLQVYGNLDDGYELCAWADRKIFAIADKTWWPWAPPFGPGCRCHIGALTEDMVPGQVEDGASLAATPPPFPSDLCGGWTPSMPDAPPRSKESLENEAAIYAFVDRLAASAPVQPAVKSGCLLGLIGGLLGWR